MEQTSIDRLIINSPYEEPEKYWSYNRERRTFSLKEGRRPAGYIVASESSKAFDDPGIFVEIPLVNRIRPRVKLWRETGYQGVTGVTKRLLEHWTNPEEFETRRFFFCQLEAIETLIWLLEAPAAEKVGIDIPPDGGAFERLCSKMATGSGKTIVMAMLTAWQIINKVTYPQDTRFSKNVLVVAPGLTVKSRLAVLETAGRGNYYEAFRIVPTTLLEKLRQGKVVIRNWHALNWENEEQLAKKRSVDKRGVKSDEAYVREVLGDMASARNILVINDEAHHAWRVPAESKVKGVAKTEIDEATIWVSGLDRIQRSRGILCCFDFSATPFAPSGKKSTDEALFGWIVSDFGLNDAIESGLVKTPRVVVRDDALPDAKTYKSRLYHIYTDATVKDDLNRRAQPEEPLPDLLLNAYYLLGYDWRETAKAWAEAGFITPPVMITVANRTETAARIKYAFDHHKVRIAELCNPERTLHIDSKVLEKAESEEEPIATVEYDDEDGDGDKPKKLTKKQQAELLRMQVDTVGQVGQPGEQIQNVISVGMLSEGWDAKTVTHIMGLRAFSSQLLCEQVVGRGLRRTSYDVNPKTGLFEPEYVNIFGVPFTFLPHESQEGVIPPPPRPKTLIEPVPERARYEISWPNIVRIEHAYKPRLSLDWGKVQSLELNASETAKVAELAPIVEGKPDVTKVTSIDLEQLVREFRMQRIIFETARDVYDQMQKDWRGSREFLLAQLVRLVEQFIKSDKVHITPGLFNQDDKRRRLIITLNMTKVVQHIWEAIRFENSEKIEPVFDQDNPIRSTGDMGTWYTGKPCEHTQKSHINFCVYDSTWESSEAFELDTNESVEAWVKNDHLGFEVLYVHHGVVRKYRPDFLIRLTTGKHIVLEVKGQDSAQNKTKRRFLDEWVRSVNAHGGFGEWTWAVSRDPGDIRDLLGEKEAQSNGGNGRDGRDERDDDYAVVKVFFATDRKLTPAEDVTRTFGSDRSSLSYGICDVSIPRDHRMGELEAPAIWKLEFRGNPAKHIILLEISLQEKDQFFLDVSKRVRGSSKESAFIFIHGYNVTFEDAARRTAQISYDLGFDGAPVFYSWPSQGSKSSYPVDEQNVEWAQSNLKCFLQDFLSLSKAKNIFLLAHSMGNRALTRAYAELITENPGAKNRFREIILTAPDIDAEVFKRDIAPAMIGGGQPITLYASSKDIALILSKKFHGYPRAGDSGVDLVLVQGIETIDATNVKSDFLGHSYYADSRSVIADIFYLIRSGSRADQRFGLTPVETKGMRYWVFKK